MKTISFSATCGLFCNKNLWAQFQFISALDFYTFKRRKLRSQKGNMTIHDYMFVRFNTRLIEGSVHSESGDNGNISYLLVGRTEFGRQLLPQLVQLLPEQRLLLLQ